MENLPVDPSLTQAALGTILALGIGGFSVFCIALALRFLGESASAQVNRFRGPRV